MRFVMLSAAALLVAATGAIAAAPAVITMLGAVTPGSYAVEPTHTRVQFAVSHMGFTNWYGDFTGVSGSLSLDPKNVARSTLDISIPVSSVSTTNTKLDGELKSADWFDANRFPTIRFVSTKVVENADKSAAVSGNLTFHGVTKPVVLAAKFNGAGINPLDKRYTVGFDASTVIRRSDFGVKTYLPVVGDEATLRISVAFEKTD